MESLSLLSELYSLAYPDSLAPSVTKSPDDMSDGSSTIASDHEDSEECKQARVEAFMKHHGIECYLDSTQKSASY